MITEKDIAEGDLIMGKYHSAFGANNAENYAYANVARIRTEAAEHALKDAADRAVLFYQQDCEGCGEKCVECIHTKQLRSAILNKPEQK